MSSKATRQRLTLLPEVDPEGISLKSIHVPAVPLPRSLQPTNVRSGNHVHPAQITVEGLRPPKGSSFYSRTRVVLADDEHESGPRSVKTSIQRRRPPEKTATKTKGSSPRTPKSIHVLLGILCLTSALLIVLFAWRLRRPISGPVDDSLFEDGSFTSNISPPRDGHATLDEKLRHLAKELGISEGELARSVQRWEEAGNGGERLISL